MPNTFEILNLFPSASDVTKGLAIVQRTINTRKQPNEVAFFKADPATGKIAVVLLAQGDIKGGPFQSF